MKHHAKIRLVSYRSTNRQGEPIPCIPIQGQFLSEFNLPVGTMVNVSYGDGFVHISKIIKNRYGNPDDFATTAVRI